MQKKEKIGLKIFKKMGNVRNFQKKNLPRAIGPTCGRVHGAPWHW